MSISCPDKAPSNATLPTTATGAWLLLLPLLLQNGAVEALRKVKVLA
jgi:hypothetical protein